MSRYPKPAEGSWTEHYPTLGTESVSYENSISREFYELEREAVFKRAWLNVGRVDVLPRNGSYFTKEIQVASTSIVVVRGTDGVVRAFHNICRHRGNKLVWSDFPKEETQGTCRQFTCKYHGWRYDLDGSLNFVQQEGEFFDLDKDAYGMVPVHCDVWEGFIFVNLAKGEPEQSLRDFLGPLITGLDGYPFDQMSERWSYRAEIHGNWKLFLDAFQEFYHAPVLHSNQAPPAVMARAREAGFEAPYYQITSPHRLISTSGSRNFAADPSSRWPLENLVRSGQFGTWEVPPIEGEVPAGVNPGNCDPWGNQSFQIFPNFVILIWHDNWYLTYNYWPTSERSHIFECTLYFVPARTPRERIGHEVTAVSFKEFALQDANTVEATHLMLASRVVDRFPLGDQEILCRHLHMEVDDWVEAYKKKMAGIGRA